MYAILLLYSIVTQVEQLHRGSVNPQQCLPLSKICVLSYFHSQVQRIRSCLRAKKLGQVSVYINVITSIIIRYTVGISQYTSLCLGISQYISICLSIFQYVSVYLSILVCIIIGKCLQD